MAETKQASLTVLGGPLGGRRIELPDDGEITIGSGEECTFRLDTPGVNPLHARVVLKEGQATVYSTGADRPLHINDNPLGTESAALRNGDILWLGVPGEDDVAMLQCILAPHPAAASTPAPQVAEPTPDIETQALWVGAEDETPAETVSPAEEPSPPPADHSADEPVIMDFEGAPEEEGIVATEAEIVSDDEIAPVDLDGGEGEDAVIVEEGEILSAEVPPTFVEAPPDLAPPPEGEVLPAEPVEAEAPTVVEAPPTPVEPVPVTPPEGEAPTPPPAPEPTPPTPPAESRPPQTPPTPARERPARRPEGPPDRSAPSASAPRRRPAPRRPAAPREPRAAEAPSRSPVMLAVAGFVGVLVVAAVGWAVWRFVLATPSPAPTPTPVAAATTAPPPSSTMPAAEPTPVAPTVEPETIPEPEVAPDAAPTPTPEVAPEPTPTPPPTPEPTPTPTPPPAAAPEPAAPAGPSPAELQAQQNAARVEELLGQADAALAARQFDAAIGHLDEALGLDPGNSRAQTTRARAVALRDLANRRFVGGRTRVQTEKAQGGGLAGFDTGSTDLRRAPDFQGRIEFEMDPPSGIGAGDPWTLRIYVVNEGEKSISVQGVTAVTEVNGAGGGGAVTPRTRQIPTQQRALVGELSGTWAEGTNSWSTQVTITANKGDSLRATVTWR